MSYNVPIINMTFSAFKSFENSQYISDIDDQQINIDCSGNSACDYAEFYYYNTGNTLHSCQNTKSCSWMRIECAMDTDYQCLLQCNGIESCKSSMFIATNVINLKCNGVESCSSMTILSTNIITMNMFFNGIRSFSDGKLLSNDTDSRITTRCNGIYSCYNSQFHYHGIEGSYDIHNTHSCNNNNSCSYTSIYAFSAIELSCNGVDYVSCEWMDIFLPFDIEELQHVFLEFQGYRDNPIFIYSIFGIDRRDNVVCTDCGWENIWLIYGISYDKLCQISEDCFNTMQIYQDNVDNVNILDTYTINIDGTYQYDLDFTKNVAFDQNVLIILSNIGDTYDVLIPPQSNNKSGIISIFCLDSSSCSNLIFNLSSIQNGVITNSASSNMRNSGLFFLS